MRSFSFIVLMLSLMMPASASDPDVTPRPVPATRPEMKRLLEDMKRRPLRIPLPQLTEEEQRALGDRAASYESRLRFHYLPREEGSVFGGIRRPGASTGNAPSSPRRDFTRNADENMTLSYPFKTMLFWIVSRTNNCQYCLGHQEWKLSAAGLTEESIAALDADWSGFTAAEQAAFGYARLLTWEPHKLAETTLDSLREHYTPLQILEMTMSTAGNNAINRWKEGIGIPQSSGNTFARRGDSAASGEASQHSDTFVTETPERFRTAISIVAPIRIQDGQSTGRAVWSRPELESREQVLAHMRAARSRTARLPLETEESTKAWLQEFGSEQPVRNWMRLIAVFPNEGRSRFSALAAREQQNGELTELQKAQINWIVARQDRAWYAVAQAFKTLRLLGQTEDQIFQLDGDWNDVPEADRIRFVFARKLAASPIALTDDDAAALLKSSGPRLMVQLINHIASCAYFDRVTEAAALPADP